MPYPWLSVVTFSRNFFASVMPACANRFSKSSMLILWLRMLPWPPTISLANLRARIMTSDNWSCTNKIIKSKVENYEHKELMGSGNEKNKRKKYDMRYQIWVNYLTHSFFSNQQFLSTVSFPNPIRIDKNMTYIFSLNYSRFFLLNSSVQSESNHYHRLRINQTSTRILNCIRHLTNVLFRNT